MTQTKLKQFSVVTARPEQGAHPNNNLRRVRVALGVSALLAATAIAQVANHYRHSPGSDGGSLRGTMAIVLSGTEKRPSLSSAFGEGFAAYSKVVGAKIEATSNEIPEMEAGKNYTDQELAALPKIKELIWKGKLKGIGGLTLRATSKNPYVVYIWVDFDSSGKSWKDAVTDIGLQPDDVNAKHDSHGWWDLSPKKIKKVPSWSATYIPEDTDRDGKKDEMEIGIGTSSY